MNYRRRILVNGLTADLRCGLFKGLLWAVIVSCLSSKLQERSNFDAKGVPISEVPLAVG